MLYKSKDFKCNNDFYKMSFFQDQWFVSGLFDQLEYVS